jgi:hypothetical protein
MNKFRNFYFYFPENFKKYCTRILLALKTRAFQIRNIFSDCFMHLFNELILLTLKYDYFLMT